MAKTDYCPCCGAHRDDWPCGCPKSHRDQARKLRDPAYRQDYIQILGPVIGDAIFQSEVRNFLEKRERRSNKKSP